MQPQASQLYNTYQWIPRLRRNCVWWTNIFNAYICCWFKNLSQITSRVDGNLLCYSLCVWNFFYWLHKHAHTNTPPPTHTHTYTYNVYLCIFSLGCVHYVYIYIYICVCVCVCVCVHVCFTRIGILLIGFACKYCFHGCECWSHPWRVKHGSRVLERSVPRNIERK